MNSITYTDKCQSVCSSRVSSRTCKGKCPWMCMCVCVCASVLVGTFDGQVTGFYYIIWELPFGLKLNQQPLWVPLHG